MPPSAARSPALLSVRCLRIARDTSTFLTLQVGISPDGSVAGAVVDQSSFQLDGGDNTNDMDGSMGIYTPSYAGDPTGGAATRATA